MAGDARFARLRSQLELSVEELVARREVADAVGTSDGELIKRVQALGFDGDSGRVFDLLPLVLVAWADGVIQRGERKRILEVLRGRGIDPGSAAHELIEALLEERPSETYMEEGLAVLRAVLNRRHSVGETIASLCIEVAEASRGMLGLGPKVSADEREEIEKIVQVLGPAAEAELIRRLG